MGDALEGRRNRRTVDLFARWFGAFTMLMSIVLFATDRWPGAVGLLVSLFPIGAMARSLQPT